MPRPIKFPQLASAAWLREQYEDRHQTIIEIATEVGCSTAAVINALQKAGIVRRDPGESRRLRGTKKKHQYEQLNDAAWLRKQYELKGLSIQAIADLIGCSTVPVHRALKQHGIASRHQPGPSAGPSVSKDKLDDRDYLYRRYVTDGLSMGALAQEIGCQASSVLKALRRLNIPTRPAKGLGNRTPKQTIPQLNDPDWLHEQFVGQRRSVGSIARELDCTRGPVMSALVKFGINRKHNRGHVRVRSAVVYPRLNDHQWLRGEYVEKDRTAQSLADEVGCTVWSVQAALCRFRILKFPDRNMEKRDQLLPQGTMEKGGYLLEYRPEHPFCNGKGYIPQHRLVCEEALGRYLTPEEEVHHLDERRSNNVLSNLVVMPDYQAHMLFHREPPTWVPRRPRIRPCPELIAARPAGLPLVFDRELYYASGVVAPLKEEATPAPSIAPIESLELREGLAALVRAFGTDAVLDAALAEYRKAR